MNSPVKKITFSALFLSLCYLLPLLGGQIPVVGKMLCLMHIPVFMAGFLLGWKYGLLIGFIAPLTRSLFFGTPIFYPDAIVMSIELATYGLSSALIYKALQKFNLNKYLNLYISLISSMLLGRAVWGITKTLILLPGNNQFTFNLFITGGFVNAWPGIVLQLVLIPLLVITVEKKINNNASKTNVVVNKIN